MKKILVLISFFVLAAFAQNTDTIDPEKKLHRAVYSFQTAAFGLSYWSNWEDSEKNPSKDGEMGFPLIRYGHIWEMTTHGAITALSTWNFTIGEGWQIHGNMLLGGRYAFFDSDVTPFVGGGLGFGMQIDSHFKDWDFGERWALGMSLGGEIGVNIFHNSAFQLEAGVGFDIIASKVDFGKSFKSVNFFFGMNY